MSGLTCILAVMCQLEIYVVTMLQIRTVAIIAEGIPENLTRKLNKLAIENKTCIIGPATVNNEPRSDAQTGFKTPLYYIYMY